MERLLRARGVNRRVMNRRVSDSTTGPPRVLDTHRAVGRSFLRHLSGIAVLRIYRFKVIDYQVLVTRATEIKQRVGRAEHDGWDGF